MNKLVCVALYGIFAALAFAQSWPVASPPKSTGPDRLDLAPDQVNNEMPINHAKLIWFVSARELAKPGEQELGKVVLGKMLDQDIASPAVLSNPRIYQFVFDLQRTIQVDRINLVIDNPGCQVTMKVSDADLSRNEGQAWREVGSVTSQVPVTTFSMMMEPVRFILLSIDTTKASVKGPVNIYEFAVFGQEDLRDYVLNLTPEKEIKNRTQFVESATGGIYPVEMLQNDLANVDAGSKVMFVSSKADDPNVSRMIDDDAQTRWTADKTEKETLVLIDLGQERRVKRMSIMHSARPGKMLIYFLNDLPSQTPAAPSNPKAALGVPAFITLAQLAKNQVTQGEVSTTDVPLFRLAQGGQQGGAPAGGSQPVITPAWLDKQTPFGSFDTGQSNFSAIGGDNILPGRYVLLRYINNDPGSGPPLLINSINVFGEHGAGELVLMPRNLPIIAAGGLTLGPPDAGTVGLSINDQLHTVPNPTPATP